MAFDLYRRRRSPWHAPHILCTGMNPGIVNMWVREGIERYGRPSSITHFEYDTAEPEDGWLPVISWSRANFLDEILNDPAGRYGRKRSGKTLLPQSTEKSEST